MQVDELIDRLDYRDNPNYICGDDLGRAVDYAHIFRRAQSRMELRGVYVLQQPQSKESQRNALVPVVYICEANDEKEASEFRRLTWNQNAAPFLIIRTPANIRLFSTFNYPHAAGGIATGRTPKAILDRHIEFQEIASVLGAFTSQSIDDGTIWRDYGRFVTPKGRVDWSLLKSLEQLDELLIAGGLEWRTSHALIGKYVYLWYLRQRDILSDNRLDEWKIDPNDVFTRSATLTAFKSVLEELENWLNGSVFPLNWDRAFAPKQEHLRRVACMFAGDTPDGQLHLAFDAYDFSIIPVETLSAIYEQFLHAHEPKKEQPRGKELGAYYTPIPLVNFMLEELNDRRPLKEGMTCFDASCGSGAFLVQCYRRLIENRVRQDGNAIRRPAELRDLLVKHIFGVDRDGDACRVTELSLILTLLDYVVPPDLLPVHNFKLPDLHNSNIFEADFFDPASPWTKQLPDKHYDWIVGNPPWVELRGQDADDEDWHVRTWIKENAKEMPISGNQIAEAFLWKITQHISKKGVAAMLVPAMTLFKDEARSFRQRFFGDQDVWCVANFANLAYILFAGRAQMPAASIFYAPKAGRRSSHADQPILCYAPFVAAQEANRPNETGTKTDTWSIVVNGSEIREIPTVEAASGDPLVWKVAMWGSRLDRELLASVARRCDRLEEVCERQGMEMHQGVELPRLVRPGREGSRPKVGSLVFTDELVDKDTIDTKRLLRGGRIYSFPNDSLLKITKEDAYLRKGRNDLPMRVSRPPHIIVDSARRFAIFSDDFIAVPGWLVGIAGQREQADLLKAISLFLSSDFAVYHQFLRSPKWGIHASIAGLDTLKAIPFPFDQIERSGLKKWSKLHATLVAAAATENRAARNTMPTLYEVDKSSHELHRLEGELNAMVNEALALRPSDCWLVSDLVNFRMKLIKGKIDPIAAGSPAPEEMHPYCETLKEELDSFFEVATDERHTVEVIHGRESAMIVVKRAPARPARDSIRILSGSSREAETLNQIRQELLRKHSQWLYFERALRCYRNGTTYLFKPMQRLQWLRSQALIDAGEIIADTAGGGGD
jgi:hypothetical protein